MTSIASWSQVSEMNFIAGIGVHREGDQTPDYKDLPAAEKQECKIRALRGYIASLDRRERWFSRVDADALRARASGLLDGALEAAPATELHLVVSE